VIFTKGMFFLVSIMVCVFFMSNKVNGMEKNFDQLISELKSPSAENRIDAAWALGELGDPRAVDYLIKALSDTDDTVRYNVVKALGNLGDNKAIPYLEKALKLEIQPWIVEAIEASINKLTRIQQGFSS
jgi:HEAT repeat protein